MNASPFDIRRNRLSEAYLLLIQAAESKTASGDILADEPDAATEAHESARRGHGTAKRHAGQKTEAQHGT